jgi:hypothetical protein
MLDSDLAHLYEVETRVLNQAAHRNEKRFPGENFMFQLLEEEYNFLRSQIVTLETGKGNHRKFLPWDQSTRSENCHPIASHFTS